MKKIVLTMAIVSVSLLAQNSMIGSPHETTSARIAMKLKELGFCHKENNILKIKKLAKNITTDRELEDLILEHI